MAYIQSVRIRSFKSFGSEPQLVEFKPGFNLICGTNGSGKSNVLDAISFAMGEKHGELRVSCLAELQNASAKERCEVVIHLRHRQQPGQGNSGSDAVHVIEGKLLPDFTKQIRVDGKIRTQKELKEFLRDMGLRFDESLAVVRQAKVTELADTNNPGKLSGLVSFSSGAGRWRSEVEQAQETLKSTQASLEETSRNIALLEDAVQKDREKEEAIQEMEKLEMDGRQHALALLAYHRTVQKGVHGETKQTEEKKAEVESRLLCIKDEASRCAKESRTLRCGLEEELKDLRMQKDQLLQSQAQVEERLRLVQEADAARHSFKQNLESVERQQKEAEKENQAAVGRLRSQQMVVDQLQRAVASAKLMSTFNAGASNQPLGNGAGMGTIIRQLESELQSKESSLASALAHAQEAEATLRVQQAEVERNGYKRILELLKLCTAQGGDRRTVDDLRRENEILAQGVSGAEAQKQELVTRLQDLKAKLGLDGISRMSLSTTHALDGLPPPPWPLHSLFRFRCSSSEERHLVQQNLVAMDIIAGSSLRNVVVVPDVLSAKALLQTLEVQSRRGPGHSGRRSSFRQPKIWPLSTIQTPSGDLAHRQRGAQHQLGGQSRVILPLSDCTTCHPQFEGVLRRSFGASVVAADNDVACSLISKFGLPSVTPQGTVRRKGSVSGGWRGQQKAPFLEMKLEHDQAEQELSSLCAYLQEETMKLERCQRCTSALESLFSSNEEQQRLQADIASLRQQLSRFQEAAAAGAPAGDTKAEAGAPPISTEELYQEAQRQLLERQSAVLKCAEKVALLEDEHASLVDLVTDAEATDEGSGQAEQHRQLQAELLGIGGELKALERRMMEGVEKGDLAQGLRAAEEKHEQLNKERQRLQAEGQKIISKMDSLKKAAASSEQQHKVLSALVSDAGFLVTQKSRHGAAAGDSNSHEAEEEDIMDVDAVPSSTQMEDTALADLLVPVPADAAAYEQAISHVRALAKRHQALREKHSAITEEERAIITHRAVELQLFNERAVSVRDSVRVLQESIDANLSRVESLNEETFEAIRTSFKDFCALLCPEKSVDLLRLGPKVDDGLAFSFSSAEDSAPGKASGAKVDQADGDMWRRDTKQLSGGQRTLLALSCLLAAARYNKSSVYLLDEADAALDSQNQAKVAQLLKEQVASRGQVLCVSHNAAFQAFATSVVNISSASGCSIVVSKGKSKSLH